MASFSRTLAITPGNHTLARRPGHGLAGVVRARNPSVVYRIVHHLLERERGCPMVPPGHDGPAPVRIIAFPDDAGKEKPDAT